MKPRTKRLADLLQNRRNVEEDILKTLDGTFKHLCPDWDYMAIDEHSVEFQSCLCNHAHLGETIKK